MDTLSFSIAPIRIPVRFGSQTFVLCDVMADDEEKWRTSVATNVTIDPTSGKPTKLGRLPDDLTLLASCLFPAELGEDDEVIAVEPQSMLSRVAEVRRWPYRVTKPLIQKLKEACGLVKEPTVEDLLEQRVKLDKQIKDLQEQGDPSKNS